MGMNRPSTSPAGGLSSRRPARHSGGLGAKLGLWSAVGILAAVLITVCANVMAVRFYERWDVTRARLYTLSPPSRETISGLSEPIEILVFLSQADPELGSVRRLLDQYQAASRLILVRYVDPDRDPATFVALQNRYRLMEGRAEQGRLVSDAALVVARGDARWVITADDIVLYDEQRGTVQPRLEQAVTEGLRQVLDPNSVQVCFSAGQLEPNLDDGGPSGLGGFRYMLEKNNYVTRQIDLAEVESARSLEQCDLLVVAAPGRMFTESVANRLVSLARRGKSLLIGAGPNLSEDGRISHSGLEPLLEAFEIALRPELVFEREPDRVLPVGVGGEVFFVEPKPHDLTRGLVGTEGARFRVALSLSQRFETRGAATALLVTSGRAFSLSNASVLATPDVALDSVKHDAEGPFVVAAAAEIASAGKDQRRARLVVMGSASPLLGNTWEDESMGGTRRFVESAISWLVSRPTLVSLDPKPERSVDLRFTEQSMSQVARYVLLYLPGTALACGAIILLRRRSGQRRAAPEPGRPAA
jgi:hypothetical protein